MVDIDNWRVCKNENPTKKGKYLLMYCESYLCWSNVTIKETVWNGHSWVLDDKYKPMKWKFITPIDIKKYGV